MRVLPAECSLAVNLIVKCGACIACILHRVIGN